MPPSILQAADGRVLPRQALFDRCDRLAGFELKLETGLTDGSASAAADLLVAAVADLGLQEVVGDDRAYTSSTEVLEAAPRVYLPP